jgi:excinuclease ABC subunit A
VNNCIIVKGAREHNLKNVNVSIPKNEFVVFTGVSGSGKSSLAFNTIYAEGQRRYVESLSAYARQFLGQMEKPDVDSIEGLTPAISIDQKITSKNPRSTVGTITEIYDYLRLLYANIGIIHCPKCKREIKNQNIDQIVDVILTLAKGIKILVLSPVIRGEKGEFVKFFDEMKKKGFIRLIVDGRLIVLPEEIELDKHKKHDIDIVIDRLIIKDGINKRLSDSVELALKISDGLVKIKIIDSETLFFSQKYACVDCGINIEKLSHRMFSFNTPYGACQTCMGLGNTKKIDVDALVPNKNLSIRQGAIVASGWRIDTKFNKHDVGEKNVTLIFFEALANYFNFSLDVPFNELSKKVIEIIMYGTKNQKVELIYDDVNLEDIKITEFEGIVNNLERKYRETNSIWMKFGIEKLMSNTTCCACNGSRLKSEVLGITINNKNIDEISNFSVAKAYNFFMNLVLTDKEKFISSQILKEINSRLNFLIDVGLDYLTLARSSTTLSGGESQRIRLATQIGSGLTGVLYVLDEPSIGLHQRDNKRLLGTLKKLRDIGNTLIVVEHDEDTVCAADYIVDIGPGAGVHGGSIVCEGNVDKIKKCEKSETGLYLSGKKRIKIPAMRRNVKGSFLEIINAEENNLKKISVKIPIGAFTAVTGVSGSGKSSLIIEVLYKALFNKLGNRSEKVGKYKELIGANNFEKVIAIDQSSIGRTPRSNPATHVGIFGEIKEIFARTNDAKVLGYSAGRFSFNVKGGRCESCQGGGTVKIEMHFLPDIYVLCEVCKGMRFNRETLQIKYKGKNIFEVLDMTVLEAENFFENLPKLKRKIKLLREVGLGYIKLGQASTTLSGGEAQRIKLAAELSKQTNGKTIYILDEPTTGLHTSDVHKLLEALQKLVDCKNTVIVIEHNLEVIKVVDYIIDLGPEGGEKGGEVVVCGTPEEVSMCKKSYTGRYLKKYLKQK